MTMTKLTPGSQVIPFSLPGVDGRIHNLADYADKTALVIIFSCNHCPYVQAWEDRMIDLQTDYNEQGVQIIAINPNDAKKCPEDSFQKMKEIARTKGFNFIYLYDESQAVARAYGAERTPEVFVFDQAGILHYHGAIDDNFREPKEVKQHYLNDALDSLLKGETPPMVETRPVGCTIKWK
jgi:peroxiredoxin